MVEVVATARKRGAEELEWHRRSLARSIPPLCRRRRRDSDAPMQNGVRALSPSLPRPSLSHAARAATRFEERRSRSSRDNVKERREE